MLRIFSAAMGLFLMTGLSNAEAQRTVEKSLAAKCDRVKSELAALQRAYASLEPKIRKKLRDKNGKVPSRSDVRFYTISAFSEADDLTTMSWEGVHHTSEPVLTSYDPEVLGCFVYGQRMQGCSRSGETQYFQFSQLGERKTLRVDSGIIHGPRSGYVFQSAGTWKIGSDLNASVICLDYSLRGERCLDVFVDIDGNPHMIYRLAWFIAGRGFTDNPENNFCGQYKKAGARQEVSPGDEVVGD